jgi:hypothetical protein
MVLSKVNAGRGIIPQAKMMTSRRVLLIFQEE